jgi:hypothetical protein
MLVRTLLVLLIALSCAPAAQAGGGQAPAASAPDDAEAALHLPVSLDRIRHLLDESAIFAEEDGRLRLNIQVRVFAPAPRIEVFRGFDLEHSPPRYGTPAHAEMVAAARPSRLGFRRGTPAANTGHLISWGGR